MSNCGAPPNDTPARHARYATAPGDDTTADEADRQRKAIGERTSEALAVMRSNGRRISRHAPYGYRLNGRGWVEDEHEQGAISLMRQLRAKGTSLRRIAEELQAKGFTNRTGKRLSPQLIANVLRRL